MTITESIHTYFQAEQTEAQIIMLGAFVFLIMGFYGIQFSKRDLLRGMGYILIPGALIFGIVGTYIYFRTESDVMNALALYHNNQAQFMQVEGARMQAVLDSFKYYFIVYLAALVLAPPLYWFGKQKLQRGIALGLIIFAACGLSIDYFASERAHVYKTAIDSINPEESAVSPDSATQAKQKAGQE